MFWLRTVSLSCQSVFQQLLLSLLMTTSFTDFGSEVNQTKYNIQSETGSKSLRNDFMRIWNLQAAGIGFHSISHKETSELGHWYGSQSVSLFALCWNMLSGKFHSTQNKCGGTPCIHLQKANPKPQHSDFSFLLWIFNLELKLKNYPLFSRVHLLFWGVFFIWRGILWNFVFCLRKTVTAD